MDGTGSVLVTRLPVAILFQWLCVSFVLIIVSTTVTFYGKYMHSLRLFSHNDVLFYIGLHLLIPDNALLAMD